MMKTLVVYDTVHGSTREVAEVIAAALEGARLAHVDEVTPDEMRAVDLLVVGAPTHGGSPSDPIKALLGRLEEGSLDGVRTASFDTRMTNKVLRIFGYAAPAIARQLQQAGGMEVVKPVGLFVETGKGPLAAGEAARAEAWVESIRKALSGKVEA